MKSLLWRTPIVSKYMIRLFALILAACVVCAGLTRSSANDADSPLRDVRLTGIVIASDLRIAIFAVTGASPLVLSEGEALKDWRLDSISPGRVVLSGPAGNIVLKPKPEADLVRSPPPAAVQSGQPKPEADLVRSPPPAAVQVGQLELGVPPGAALAGASWQPLAETPIAVGNLSAATPVQTQSYPYYFPEYYGGYNQYYPSYDYYPFPFPYLVYAVPTRVGFRFGFFHHHGGFMRGGLVRGGAFHGGGPGGRR